MARTTFIGTAPTYGVVGYASGTGMNKPLGDIGYRLRIPLVGPRAGRSVPSDRFATSLRVCANHGRPTGAYSQNGNAGSTWKQWVCGDPQGLDDIITWWNASPASVIAQDPSGLESTIRKYYTRVEGPHMLCFNGEQRWCPNEAFGW
jgi:hypothetical protein